MTPLIALEINIQIPSITNNTEFGIDSWDLFPKDNKNTK